jgi:hypothetical protein
MKTVHWAVVLLIVAVATFAVAFGINYLGRRPSGSGAEEYLSLNFPLPAYRPRGAPAVCELGKTPSCDVWFFNANDREVKVGLADKSCTCAAAYLYQVPVEEPATYLAARVGIAGALAPAASHFAPALTGLVLLDAQEDWGTTRLSGRGPGAELTRQPGVTVAPHAVGAVRMTWKPEGKENRQVVVKLWTDTEDNPHKTTLDLLARVVPAVQVAADYEFLDVGSLSESDLPYTATVYCYSQTRSWLPLEPRPLRGSVPAEKDPFQIGALTPLTEEECRALEQTYKIPHLLCGFKVAVTLRLVSPDGTVPCALGRFRRPVEFRWGDDGAEPQYSVLMGEVKGFVTVGDSEGGGRIDFGSFPSAQGKEYVLTLESDVAGLDLEVDTSRVADFLEPPQLGPPDVAPSGHRTWRLHVKVSPGKAVGTFPNPADPIASDCAIYVKTKEKRPRSIRIPVTGTADVG